MANQREASCVYDYVVATRGQVEFIEPRPKYCKFEKRARKRHWRALDR
jgi:hypothetical protein